MLWIISVYILFYFTLTEANAYSLCFSSFLTSKVPSSSSSRLTESSKENFKSQNETFARLMSERNFNVSSRRMLPSSMLEKKKRRRYFADRIPEVHLLGEITGAEGYYSSETVSCSW